MWSWTNTFLKLSGWKRPKKFSFENSSNEVIRATLTNSVPDRFRRFLWTGRFGSRFGSWFVPPVVSNAFGWSKANPINPSIPPKKTPLISGKLLGNQNCWRSTAFHSGCWGSMIHIARFQFSQPCASSYFCYVWVVFKVVFQPARNDSRNWFGEANDFSPIFPFSKFLQGWCWRTTRASPPRETRDVRCKASSCNK